MGRNNFGLRSRDMGKAGEFALNQAARSGAISYSTAGTLAERWNQFVEHAKSDGTRWMEDIRADQVRAWGRDLADQVRNGEMSPSYAQNLVSAVNTVMNLATKGRWDSVSPTKACGIAQRSAIRVDAPSGMDRSAFGAAMESLRESGLHRQASIAELARDLGLRSKEASMLDARAALAEARERGAITVTEGTKGGREREIPITGEHQIQALERAAEIQGDGRNLIPSDQTWKEWRDGGLRDGREAVQEAIGGHGYHDLRAAYACERYEALTGHDAPVFGGRIEDRDLDREARMKISEELGHGRIDVVAEYLGGRG
ncbi:MAG: integrase domain-containing protein [Bacillota bacterium]